MTVTFTVMLTPPWLGSGGTFAGGVNTAVTNASGIATSATFTANSGAGLYTVQASAPSITGVANFALTNTPGPPAKVIANSFPQSTAIGIPFPSQLSAQVTDAGGNLVSGVTVTFTPPASGPSASFAGGMNTGVTNNAGVATSALPTANNTVGMYAVMASVAGVSTPAALSLSNTATQATTITATSGTPQTTPILTPFASPLWPRLRMEPATPVSGAIVWFSAPLQAYVTFSSGPDSSTYLFAATTNGAGIATSGTLVANKLAASYTVQAIIPGQPAYTTFSMTNIPGPPATITAYIFPPRRKKTRSLAQRSPIRSPLQ